jgi:hypothetical protein
MAELAVNGIHYNDDGTLNKVNYSDMWDSHMIRGCHCARRRPNQPRNRLKIDKETTHVHHSWRRFMKMA